MWRDEAEDECGKREEFFRRTFLTEGLRDLLLNATRRLRGEGGDPVVQLQTNFGGGKTHSLIALYRLAAGYEQTTLPGVEQMLAEAGIGAPPGARRVVLVGQMIDPGSTRSASLDEVAEFSAKASEIAGTELANLRALGAPEGDEAKIDEMLGLIQQEVDAASKLEGAAKAGDANAINEIVAEIDPINAQADQLAKDYGLKERGKEGA